MMPFPSSFLGRSAKLVITTWNPADKGPYCTLSNNNLTVANSATSSNYARSVAGKTSGKWYFECTATNPGNNLVIGIASGTADPGGYVGSTGSIGYTGSGEVDSEDAAVASYSRYNTGEPIGVAFDMAAKKVWFARNGVWQAGSPGGTGGIGFSYPQVFAAGAPYYSSITANFGASAFAYPAPTGFSPLSSGNS